MLTSYVLQYKLVGFNLPLAENWLVALRFHVVFLMNARKWEPLEFYFHTWHVYGVEMYKLVNSELDKMNEKQFELSECMIAFDKIHL